MLLRYLLYGIAQSQALFSFLATCCRWTFWQLLAFAELRGAFFVARWFRLDRLELLVCIELRGAFLCSLVLFGISWQLLVVVNVAILERWPLSRIVLPNVGRQSIWALFQAGERQLNFIACSCITRKLLHIITSHWMKINDQQRERNTNNRTTAFVFSGSRCC